MLRTTFRGDWAAVAGTLGGAAIGFAAAILTEVKRDQRERSFQKQSRNDERADRRVRHELAAITESRATSTR